MSKWFVCFLIAALVVLPACGGGDDGGNDAGGEDTGSEASSVEDVETCEQLADLAIVEMQALLDGIDELSSEEIQGLGAAGAVQEFEETKATILEKGSEIGCTDEGFQTLIQNRADVLEAGSPVAGNLLRGMQGGTMILGFESTE